MCGAASPERASAASDNTVCPTLLPTTVFTNKQHLEPIPHHFDRRMSAYEAKRSPKRMASGTSNHTEAEPAMSFDEDENVVPAELVKHDELPAPSLLT